MHLILAMFIGFSLNPVTPLPIKPILDNQIKINYTKIQTSINKPNLMSNLNKNRSIEVSA